MKKELVERFANLFAGGQLGYGLWDKQKGARTVHEPPSISNYEAHLNGEIGLGVVPVQENGTCRFAAIDIDVDTIDHAQLFTSVSKRRLPLVVCRSKSGGAHLYTFMAQGYPAAVVTDVLKKWATLLGYPRAEIFPKQNVIGSNNVGSWINLPYFSGDNSTRHAWGPNGMVPLEEFLGSITWFHPDAKVDETVETSSFERMPPCLAHLSKIGVQEGGRNNALTNFAIFFRKVNPDTWIQDTIDHHTSCFDPPLGDQEIRSTLRSINTRGYMSYTCGQEPLCSNCDRPTCEGLEFGVKHRPWTDSREFDSNIVTDVRKILTDPPTFELAVNGRELKLDFEQLYNYREYAKVVLERLNLAINPNKKQGQWVLELKELLRNATMVEVPDNASLDGRVMEHVQEFLARYKLAQNREDLARGLPVQINGSVYFRSIDVLKYLEGYRIKYPDHKLHALLRKYGVEGKMISIGGKKLNIRYISVEAINDQKDDYTPADFAKDFEM